MTTTEWNRTDRLALAVLLALAVVLRLGVAWQLPSIVHPDETWDYLEKAYKLAFGQGIDTWRYEYGMRPLFFPALLGAAMRVGHALGGSYDAALAGVSVLMALLSLPAVAVAYLWGRRAAGLVGGVICGALGAVWYEFLYFSPHALTEVLAADLLLPAAYLLAFAAPGARGRPAAAAALLVMAAYARPQVAPAVAVVGAWLLFARARGEIAWAASGGVCMFALLGVLDWISFGHPFQSIAMMLYSELYMKVASYYGEDPFFHFFRLMFHYWGGAFALVVALAAAGARRLPLPAAMALALLVAHTMIGHKEYRFIYPAIMLGMLLAGVGSAMVLERLVPALRVPERGPRMVALVTGLAVLFWSVTSLALATQGPFRREWQRVAGRIAASREVARLPEVCGIGFWKIDGGSFSRHMAVAHRVPMFGISTPSRFAADAVSFNVLLAPDDALPPDGIFALRRCFFDGYAPPGANQRRAHVCVLTRPGSCAPGAVNDPDPNRPPGW